MNEPLTIHQRNYAREIHSAAYKTLENSFALTARAYDLPPLERNYQFDSPDSKMELDYAHVPSKVGVEIQGGIWMKGGAHARPKNIERDIRKMNAAQMKGWLVILLTSKTAQDGTGAILVGKAIQQRLGRFS